jgi:hypothetical protein
MWQSAHSTDNNAPLTRVQVEDADEVQRASSASAFAPHATLSPVQLIPSLPTVSTPSGAFADPVAEAAHPGLLEYQTANWDTSTTAAAHSAQLAEYIGAPMELPMMQTGYVNNAIQQLSIGDETVQIGYTPMQQSRVCSCFASRC